MKLTRRTLAFVVVAAILAALFVRLGFWQLSRGEERREVNRSRAERLRRPPLELAAGGPVPAADSVAWRRVRLRGVYDFDREAVIRGRSDRGRPGVWVLTPLRQPGAAPAVLVVRGWLPAPDAIHAPLSAGRPRSGTDAGAPDSEAVTVEGIALPGERASEADGQPVRRMEMEGDSVPVLARADPYALAPTVPYALAPFVVRATEPGATGPRLQRLPEPALDPGPHLSYAIQWFAFALIALGGAGAYAISRARRETDR